MPSPLTRGGREGFVTDIPGLCKAATLAEIEARGWSLNPGRYVGVAAGEEVSDEDFKEKLETLNEELEVLNCHHKCGDDPHGTTLSVKAPDAAQIDILPFPNKIVENYRPFPFKGKARMGMGSFATFNPIPTPTLPLKGRGFAIIVLKVVPWGDDPFDSFLAKTIHPACCGIEGVWHAWAWAAD